MAEEAIPVERPAISAAARHALVRCGLYLEYTTLGWNVVGSVIVIAAAIAARSVALAGFGLNSLIEIVASLVVVWELTGADTGRERRGLRVIGIAFLLLAVYIFAQSAFTLVSRSHPHPSPTGIVWLAATLAAMLLLAWGTRVTGTRIANAVLMTEAHVTLIDALLAAAFGWWWADPLAGLMIVSYGLKEGMGALRGEGV